MGTPEIAATTLEGLLAGSDPVVGVVTQPDRPSGRGQTKSSSPVRQVAEALKRGAPLITALEETPEVLRDEDLLALAHRYQVENRYFAGVVYAHQMRV